MTLDAGVEMTKTKSFWREWGALIAFAVLFVGLVVGTRVWTDYQAQQPVLPVYANYLNSLADRSLSANAALKRYYQAYARSTVASKDFLNMCKGLTRLALKDGVDVATYSTEFAKACAPNQFAESLFDSLPQVDGSTGEITPPPSSGANNATKIK